MNVTVDLTAVPLWLVAVFQLALFFLTLGVAALCYALTVGFRSLRSTPDVPDEPVEPAESAPVSQMLVVAPWSNVGASDVLAGEVLWRHQIEAEPAPTFAGTPLPEHVSVWRFDDWKSNDPHRTQGWPIIKGYDADDLDPGPEPKVNPELRRRFVRTDAEMSALAAAQGFQPKTSTPRLSPETVAAVAERLPKTRSRTATVDLEANTVVVSA